MTDTSDPEIGLSLYEVFKRELERSNPPPEDGKAARDMRRADKEIAAKRVIFDNIKSGSTVYVGRFHNRIAWAVDDCWRGYQWRHDAFENRELAPADLPDDPPDYDANGRPYRPGLEGGHMDPAIDWKENSLKTPNGEFRGLEVCAKGAAPPDRVPPIKPIRPAANSPRSHKRAWNPTKRTQKQPPAKRSLRSRRNAATSKHAADKTTQPQRPWAKPIRLPSGHGIATHRRLAREPQAG